MLETSLNPTPKPEEFRTIPRGHAAPFGIDSTRVAIRGLNPASASTRRLSPAKPKQFRTIPHGHAAPCGIDSTRAATRRLGPGSMAWALATQTIPHHPACSCRSVWN